MTGTRLVWPTLAELPEYVAALERGWSPDNVQPEKAVREQLARIAQDPEGFLAGMDDPEAREGPVERPDGSFVPRLPGIRRWIWHDGFCGSIGLRWQDGTSELPGYVLGHIGYSIVPWRRRAGHATWGLALMLTEARGRGLEWVEVTTQPGNIPSQRVILGCGGVLVGTFEKAAAYGGGEALLFRIDLANRSQAATTQAATTREDQP